MTRGLTTTPMTQAFEARLSQRIDDLARRIGPARRARLRWAERMPLVSAIAAQGLRREEAEDESDLKTLHSLTSLGYPVDDAPHPGLIALVRALARQAAEADLSAQRSAPRAVAPNITKGDHA